MCTGWMPAGCGLLHGMVRFALLMLLRCVTDTLTDVHRHDTGGLNHLPPTIKRTVSDAA